MQDYEPDAATLARIKARAMERLRRPCRTSGDLTLAELCPACQEDQLIDRQRNLRTLIAQGKP